MNPLYFGSFDFQLKINLVDWEGNIDVIFSYLKYFLNC
jgi:hypothetical protein